MTKQTISRILFAVLIISNVYLVYRINANIMSIASYDAGISQRSGVGQLKNYWAEYIGGSRSSGSYADKERAESDSQIAITVLIILDIVIVGSIYFLNKKPAPKPEPVEDDSWRKVSRRRRR